MKGGVARSAAGQRTVDGTWTSPRSLNKRQCCYDGDDAIFLHHPHTLIVFFFLLLIVADMDDLSPWILSRLLHSQIISSIHFLLYLICQPTFDWAHMHFGSSCLHVLHR